MKLNFFEVRDYSTEELKKIAQKVTTDWFFLQIKQGNIKFNYYAEDRFISIAQSLKSSLIYSDYYEDSMVSLIECQKGSLRDDFDFGYILFINSDVFREVISEMNENYSFGGLYDLRLRLSEKGDLFHISEPLYVVDNNINQNSHNEHFAYVDRSNRDVQKEMEKVFTSYLSRQNALLTREPRRVDLSLQSFEYEASIIIPVKNRERTITDAIQSAISQETTFKFNVLIVNNFSTDSTGELIKDLEDKYDNVFQIIPDSKTLGIGGCWNLAIADERCGKFAVQLDSDDLYEDSNTLQTIIDEFYRQECAMLIGSYTITDFSLKPIPPYLIDHSEWTDDNGRNNALRINGLGAPRAFFTPIVREIKFPNVSYGEDYAVGLRISREWRIGRIYKSLYLCRRWENNSDSNIDMLTVNKYNAYKDKIRTMEFTYRKQLNTNKNV